jgi:hypothetical protein
MIGTIASGPNVLATAISVTLAGSRFASRQARSISCLTAVSPLAVGGVLTPMRLHQPELPRAKIRCANDGLERGARNRALSLKLDWPLRLAARRLGHRRIDAVARELRGHLRPDSPRRRNVDVAAGEVLLPALGHAAPIERGHLGRIDPQRRVIVDDGVVVPAGLEMHEGAAVERIDEVGFQSQRFVAIRQRGLQLPDDRTGPTPAVPGCEIGRLQTGDMIVVGHGGDELLPALVRDTAAEVGADLTVIETQRLIVVGDGADRLALLEQRIAAIVERDRILGIDLDGFVIVADGLVDLALALVGDAAVDQGVLVFGIDRQRMVVIRDGAIRIALA